MLRKYINSILFIGTIAVLLSSCKSGKNNPGRDYMPDMRYSKAYETYSSADYYFKDNDGAFDTMTALLPVKGTIARGFVPADETMRNDDVLASLLYKQTFAGLNQDSTYMTAYSKAGSLINPLTADKATLATGKRIYEVNCKVCHGEKGEGDGSIVVSADGSDGPYTAVPPAFSSRLSQLTDGQIFFTISCGKGNMGAYGPVIKPIDRWKVVHYIKDMAGVKAGAAVTTDSTKVGG